MMRLHCVLLMVYTAVLWRKTDSIACLSCKDAVKPRDCSFVDNCAENEVCYVDELVSATGYIKFNLGCRDIQQCGAVPFGRRSSSETKICSECCNGTICNNEGCGQAGYDALNSGPRGPICYSCNQQSSPEHCNEITMCGREQMCQLNWLENQVTHDAMYQTTCQEKHTCLRAVSAYGAASVVGRRSNHEAVIRNTCRLQCCDTDLCNSGCLYSSASTTASLQYTTPSIVGQDKCLSNPCVHGSCQPHQETYICSCKPGASGRNCEKFADPCTLQPCIHGTCTSNLSVYTCTCNAGYTGKTCNADHCASAPCQHGTCTSNTSGYTCVCDSQHHGQNCDAVIDPCIYNPCVYGTCVSNMTSYNCTCLPGYAGANCDAVLHDPCTSNPCNYGTCHRNVNAVNGYTCTCEPCYYGNRCEKNADTFNNDVKLNEFYTTNLTEVYVDVNIGEALVLDCDVNASALAIYCWQDVHGCFYSRYNFFKTQKPTITHSATFPLASTYACSVIDGVPYARMIFHVKLNTTTRQGSITKDLCTFDDGDFCDWNSIADKHNLNNNATYELNWSLGRGASSIPDTGPERDHTLKTMNGGYLYINSSLPRIPEDGSILFSHVINRKQPVCFTFYYNMYGAGVGRLQVVAKLMCLDTEYNLFIKSGNQGPGWHHASVYMPSGLATDDYRIHIRADVAIAGHGEIAIDDLLIEYGPCEGTGTVAGTGVGTGASYTCPPINCQLPCGRSLQKDVHGCDICLCTL